MKNEKNVKFSEKHCPFVPKTNKTEYSRLSTRITIPLDRFPPSFVAIDSQRTGIGEISSPRRFLR